MAAVGGATFNEMKKRCHRQGEFLAVVESLCRTDCELDLPSMALIYTCPGQFKMGETWNKPSFGEVDINVLLRLCTLESHSDYNLLSCHLAQLLP